MIVCCLRWPAALSLYTILCTGFVFGSHWSCNEHDNNCLWSHYDNKYTRCVDGKFVLHFSVYARHELPYMVLLYMYILFALCHFCFYPFHYNDVIMSAMAFQITGPTCVYSTVDSGADQRKHQSSASLAFVLAIHRWAVNSPHKAFRGQWHGKCFHLLTSSCNENLPDYINMTVYTCVMITHSFHI